MSKHYKITLVKSLIGRSEKHRLSVKALGLKRIGDSRVVMQDAPTDGLIKKVSYLLAVEEVK